MNNDLDYAVGQTGWVVPDVTGEQAMLDAEKRYFDKAAEDNPVAYQQRPAIEMLPKVKEKWDAFQLSKGRFAGSNDLTLSDEFVFGKSFTWFPQDIGSCFPAGTLIRMADGSHKPIERIGLFNEVLTAEGNVGYVSQVGGREISEQIYVIKLWGHMRVRMTEEHPLLTKRGYVKASEIRLDDYVSLPKYAPASADYVQTADHVAINRQMRLKVASGATTGRHKTTAGYVKIYRSVPDAIKLTPEFGWLSGIYLAEGCSDGNKLVFTFHPEEQHTLAARVVKLFAELFDIEASLTVQKCPGKRNPDGTRERRERTCRVSVHSVAWASMFESLFGIGSKGKRLHADLACGPVEFLREVYIGWLDGDGHTNRNGTDGVTISKALALDMHAIASVLGLEPSLSSCDPAASHGVVERQRRYDVRVPASEQRLCSESSEKAVWKKVKGIETELFTGRVYNFEVPGDNSYVADGLGVHNCVWSNTFRRWFERMCVEIALNGDPEEYVGKMELGPESLAPFCVSYGFARQRANMRSGDGLYCKPMQESLLKDGVILCSTPKLKELLAAENASGESNYPEPRSAALYRKIGNWAWNEALRPYTDCKLLESVFVKTVDQWEENANAMKPMFQCSMIAVRKDGKDKDGFDIHTRDTRNSWAHCMGWAGVWVNSAGEKYGRLCNTSWLQRGSANIEQYIYNIRLSEIKSWFDRGTIDVSSIGEIDGIKSAPSI